MAVDLNTNEPVQLRNQGAYGLIGRASRLIGTERGRGHAEASTVALHRTSGLVQLADERLKDRVAAGES
jgi:hypothetical protein